MTRSYYRLSLSALCGLAAGGGPILFLEDRLRAGYLLGGLFAALAAWGVLLLAVGLEPYVKPYMAGILGAGAAWFSWAAISLVAVFDVIPHISHSGMARFDPVWVMGGLAPLVILPVAGWRARHEGVDLTAALLTALFRYSAPLWVLQRLAVLLGLAKQYRWLALFAGVMFLVLDGLGTGDDLPFRRARHT